MTDSTATTGGGCAKGCLIILAAGFALLVLLIGGGWFLYHSAVERFTSPHSGQIALDPISDAAYQTAANKLERFQRAVTAGEKQVIEFTATDLNALIARHPAFANPRRQLRFKMADSIIILDFNVPLDEAKLPGLKNRWLNGSATLSFDYSYEQFRMRPKSVTLNEHQLPETLFSESFVSSFNRSFTKSFMNALARNRQSEVEWKNIESITVRDDKLIVITRPGEQTNSALQPNESWPSRRIVSRDLPGVHPCILSARKFSSSRDKTGSERPIAPLARLATRQEWSRSHSSTSRKTTHSCRQSFAPGAPAANFQS